MTKTINLTIDHVKVSVPEGTLVVDAAKKAGINIPVFCYHPKMEPVGMCRQCLVEIGRPMMDRATGKPVLDADGSPKMQFMPKLETACTNPVSEGMTVFTSSEKARTGQKEILELLLTSHPLDCPICDKGGECPLQNLTMKYGSDDSRFIFDEKQHLPKHLALGDLIFIDRERCIQCGRCIRFQKDIANEPVIGFYNRGRDTDVVTFTDPGFDSIFSGNTTDICPVGALTTADFRFGARPWEMKNAASVCSQCSVGCNVTFNVRREAKSGGDYVIKRVLPRQNEAVNEIWLCDKGRFASHHFAEDDSRLVLDEKTFAANIHSAAEKLAAAGSDAVILAGGHLANEDLFNLKQLAAGLGAKIQLYGSLAGGEFSTAYGLSAGSNLGDLGKGDAIVVFSSDLHQEAPIWHLRLLAAAKHGASLIVVGARETSLEKSAQFVVRIAYGDEVKTARELSGKEKIGEVLSTANNLVIFAGSDGLGPKGYAALSSACADLVRERAGKPNNGLVNVWSSPNAQGAWEMGLRPAQDLASELNGKTVYVVAADPAGDDPRLAEALKSAKSVIVQDVLATATTRLADVILAAAPYTEREGTYTSAERRVQRFYPAVPSRGGSKADFSITAQIAQECGIELEGKSAMLVMNQIAASEKAFSGISYSLLSEVPDQWPLVGTGDLYYGGTSYKNKQGLGAHLQLAGTAPAPVAQEAVLRPTEDALMAVPVTKLYDRSAAMNAAKLLASHVGAASVAIHPAAAAKYGLSNGDLAVLKINDSETEVSVCLDDSIGNNVVLVYRSFGVPISEPIAVEILAAQRSMANSAAEEMRR